jgi:hypothetical protein
MYTDEIYLTMCNKYFAPLDEIAEALRNGEGLYGISAVKVKAYVLDKVELQKDLLTYEGIEVLK